MTAQRAFVIIGNWKMHKTVEEARTFIQGFVASYQPSEDKRVGLAVPYTLIYPLAQELQEQPLVIGAQNMNDASEGAFTGEIAGNMLTDAGARFVLIGHSERRHLYGEDNACINRKLKQAIKCGLQPILCIGETEQEFEAKETHAVLEKQLTEGLEGISAKQLKNLVIAYEPVWAIGTQKSATPDIAQEIHAFCRKVLGNLLKEELADKIIIQYGGSVNPTNAKKLLAQPDIDGLLIGGASLLLDSFLEIVNNDYAKL